ncbi:MAG: BglG family transcription antiterminator [Bacillota bacterium]
MLTKRTSEILHLLINNNRSFLIKELANLLSVSKRTIRYDLDSIDDFLIENNFEKLIRKPKMGIKLNDEISKSKLIENISYEKGTYSYVLSPDERIKIILCELLQRKDYITTKELSEILMVSRSTVINDLKKVKKWLKDRDIQFISLPNYGLKIKGEEKKIRRATIEILTEALDINKTINVAKKTNKKDVLKCNSYIMSFLENIDIDFIERCIKEAEKSLNLIFSDSAFYGMVVHIGLAIKRIKLGKDISMPLEELELVKNTDQFKAASKMVTKIENHFEIKVPKDEIGYITVHMLGGNLFFKNKNENSRYFELEMIINMIIEKVSVLTRRNLFNDSNLFDGLLTHLKPAIYRLRYGLNIENPIIKKIKEEYSELFEIVKLGVEPLESYVGKNLSDHEIGYLTIHFAGALERIEDKTKSSKKVLFVCATGTATAKLIAAKVAMKFNITIVGFGAKHQLEDFIKNKDIDLIISTIKIENINVDSVTISPLLNKTDIENLKKHLNIKINKQSKSYKEIKDDSLMDSIIEIIENNCEIKDQNNLISELNRFLNKDNNINLNKNNIQLKDLLNSKTISLDVKANNWKEAVIKSGNILLENKLIDPTYINAMIKSIKDIGPYIVISQGVALPHARIQDGVKKSGMSFIRLKNSVNFGNKDNDPVDLIFAICTENKGSLNKALCELAKILDNENKINILRNSKSIDEITSIL